MLKGFVVIPSEENHHSAITIRHKEPGGFPSNGALQIYFSDKNWLRYVWNSEGNLFGRWGEEELLSGHK